MPTNTDLVTDLPADFEVFGQAVDTSLADLKGGTTGQILSKATNTDMDFVWITNDVGDITGVTATSPLTGGGTSGAVTVGIQSATTSQSGAVQLSDSTSTTSSVLAATPTAVKSAYDLAAAAIPKSTVTAKGSIVAATASSTPANLAVGNNGESLVADSSTSTGLRYQAAKAQNAIYNSSFDIFQRSSTPTTGITTTGGINYTLDRWMARTANAGGSINVSQQSAGNLSVTPTQAIRYCARVQRVAGNTDTGEIGIYQTLETADSVQYAGKTLTISFYARKGTNYSATSNYLTVALYSGTGTDQVWYSFTGQTTMASSGTNTLTSSWQRFTISGTAPTNMTEMYAAFTYAGIGTAGAADYFEVTGIQVEAGNVATAFNRMSGTIQGELAACQRYYWRGNATSTTYATYGTGFCWAANTANVYVSLPIQMRKVPTVLEYANLIIQDSSFSGAGTQTYTISGTESTPNLVTIYTDSATGLTANRPVYLRNNNNTAGYIGFGAEL
jgi:hypothetical protein